MHVYVYFSYKYIDIYNLPLGDILRQVNVLKKLACNGKKFEFEFFERLLIFRHNPILIYLIIFMYFFY